MNKPELLIPAGSPEVFRTAVTFGADAVYIGGEAFSLRSKARNFSPEEMRECIGYAHERGVKVYVTANILVHNADLPEIRAYFEELKGMKPDALIITDPGAIMLAREICPEIDIHLSTQANAANYLDCLFWQKEGVKRIILARELTLKEIAEIRGQIPEELELEAFVHGAMCISYSGRCLLSNFFANRDGNRGECTHPCRWRYSVMEEKRPGEYWPVYENERGSFIFNSKDLCMVDHIPDLIDAGIDSFKVEGRMKNALYVATTARTYRRAIDDCLASRELYEQNLDRYREQISACTHRDFTTGFYYGPPDENSQIYGTFSYKTDYTYLGIVGEISEDGCAVIEQRNKFSLGEEIEIMKPDGRNVSAVVEDIRDEDGTPMESAPHPQQKLWVRLSGEAESGDILRRKETLENDPHIFY